MTINSIPRLFRINVRTFKTHKKFIVLFIIQQYFSYRMRYFKAYQNLLPTNNAHFTSIIVIAEAMPSVLKFDSKPDYSHNKTLKNSYQSLRISGFCHLFLEFLFLIYCCILFVLPIRPHGTKANFKQAQSLPKSISGCPMLFSEQNACSIKITSSVECVQSVIW